MEPRAIRNQLAAMYQEIDTERLNAMMEALPFASQRLVMIQAGMTEPTKLEALLQLALQNSREKLQEAMTALPKHKVPEWLKPLGLDDTVMIVLLLLPVLPQEQLDAVLTYVRKWPPQYEQVISQVATKVDPELLRHVVSSMPPHAFVETITTLSRDDAMKLLSAIVPKQLMPN